MTNVYLTKCESLISRSASMPEPGPYYTTLVDMKDIDSFPFDYTLYCSTDDHDGVGGIYLYLCNGLPSAAEHWQSYDDAATWTLAFFRMNYRLSS